MSVTSALAMPGTPAIGHTTPPVTPWSLRRAIHARGGVLGVESRCQADFASRMIVTAVWGSGTVIVTLRPLCRASRRAGPVRTVK
jgi:hypothetical protein